MRTNNKGFTLIELLAMLVVLGILMAVTVPNITGILGQSKTNAYVDDAALMIDAAKIKIATNKDIKKPANGKCIVLSLAYINDSDDLAEYETGKDGYYKYDSFVLVKREGAEYNYYLRLIKHVDDTNMGFESVLNYKDFLADPASNINEVSSFTKVEGDSDFSIAVNSVTDKPKVFNDPYKAALSPVVGSVCSSENISAVYAREA